VVCSENYFVKNGKKGTRDITRKSETFGLNKKGIHQTTERRFSKAEIQAGEPWGRPKITGRERGKRGKNWITMTLRQSPSEPAGKQTYRGRLPFQLKTPESQTVKRREESTHDNTDGPKKSLMLRSDKNSGQKKTDHSGD